MNQLIEKSQMKNFVLIERHYKAEDNFWTTVHGLIIGIDEHDAARKINSKITGSIVSSDQENVEYVLEESTPEKNWLLVESTFLTSRPSQLF